MRPIVDDDWQDLLEQYPDWQFYRMTGPTGTYYQALHNGLTHVVLGADPAQLALRIQIEELAV